MGVSGEKGELNAVCVVFSKKAGGGGAQLPPRGGVGGGGVPPFRFKDHIKTPPKPPLCDQIIIPFVFQETTADLANTAPERPKILVAFCARESVSGVDLGFCGLSSDQQSPKYVPEWLTDSSSPAVDPIQILCEYPAIELVRSWSLATINSRGFWVCRKRLRAFFSKIEGR